ncbi:MAG TPA: hypothetical protein VNA57_03620 [Acidimicrobiales bacterium]|nr:hypothetical protein [Acidimicrobiales bacterium]
MQSPPRRHAGIALLAAALTLISGLVGLSLSPTAAAADPTARNPYAWPFSSDSIWNMPVGSGATFADPNFFQPPNGYGTDSNPIVMAPSSPLRPVHTHAWPARCHQSGDASSGVSLPIPDDYVVAPGDGSWEGKMPNLAGGALLADGRTIREFNYLSRCDAGGPASLTGDGLRSTLDLYGNGRPSSFFGGHGGSGLSGVGGSIRRGELTGVAPIRHVTKLTVDMSRWGTREADRNAYQWPAYAADSNNTGQNYGVNARGYTPILKMGSLLSIPGWVDINSLGLETGPARKLAEAWQNYGSYVVDNSGFDTGWGQNLLNVEHGVKAEMAAAGINMSTYSNSGWSDTAWNRDMNRLFDQLHHVTNNGPGSIGGGGTPRVALAPPFGEPALLSGGSIGARPSSGRSGYWMVAQKGAVYAFGAAPYLGNAPVRDANAVDIEATSGGDGYWVVDTAGRVFAFGTARWHGNATPLSAGESVTSLSRTRSGNGYWMFTTKGRVLTFGDATHFGDMAGKPLNGPIRDSVTTSRGDGYYMVASDGGTFAFGAAAFHGSMGGKRLNAPVQSLVPDPDGDGYYMVASDGGVFAFSAPFRGSLGDLRLNKPVSGMVSYGNGYLLVAADGGAFVFSDKPFDGSLGSNPPPSPVVAVTVLG